MDAIKQSCRPKHQVLILKCYPRFQKNAVEVKPNSSELSYLLYYASTRRSKAQKVGAFLEKRTARDIWRGRSGNVQVTLQILRALIEKSPRDLPLYAPYLLRILGQVFRSRDITLVEETVLTFQTFCEHHDVERLSADQEYAKLYEDTLRSYASFAARGSPPSSPPSMGAPLAIRWRSVGLKSIKSITATESFGADGVGHLSIIMPPILQNLYSDSEEYLLTLQEKAQLLEKSERESLIKHRSSIGTAQTSENADGESVLAKTTADADKLAEEEVGALALQCLKQIVSVNARGRIRMATAETLKFIATKDEDSERPPTSMTTQSTRLGSWVTTLMEMIAKWTPVQDRFIIVVTAMETLIGTPTAEANLTGQLILSSIVSWLLSSPINLIGLSVMDVLLGLIQHILLLLRLGGKGTPIQPHHQQAEGLDMYEDAKKTFEQRPATAAAERAYMSEKSSPRPSPVPSPLHHELLLRLERCISDLATHVYYSEQISDMIKAILSRLKPLPSSSVPTAVDAVQNPSATVNAIVSSANMKEVSNSDDFFSFTTARLVALRAIKEIIVTANSSGFVTGATTTGRNRIGVHVWEGTQWLLRDEKDVRIAYVDAILTWLRLETDKTDLRVMSDRLSVSKSSRKDMTDLNESKLGRRAVSLASRQDKTPKTARLTFLQLLHLAIYENALEFPEDEDNILLLHILLWNLVERLGVNAVRTGLPMIFRLQEDIDSESVVPTPRAKINVGSLVHAYFLQISEKFDFKSSSLGFEIKNEVDRRKDKGLWLDKVRLPPLELQQIDSISNPVQQTQSLQGVEKQSLRAFDSRPELVDQISSNYSTYQPTPPGSPPGSPSRNFALPALGHSTAPQPNIQTENQLPLDMKEDMLAEWSRESCIAMIEKQSFKESSLAGSKSGTIPSRPGNFLGVNGSNSPVGSNTPSHTARSLYTQRPGSTQGGLSNLQRLRRRPSAPEGSTERVSSSSSRSSTVRVDELKRVLSISARGSGPLELVTDTDSESEATLDFSTSDGSFSQNGSVDGEFSGNRTGSPLSREDAMSKTYSQETAPSFHPRRADSRSSRSDDVPPVPPLPSSFASTTGYPSDSGLLVEEPSNTDNSPTPRPPSTQTNNSRTRRSSSATSSSHYSARPKTAPGRNSGGFYDHSRSFHKGKSRPGTRGGKSIRNVMGGEEWNAGLGIGLGRPGFGVETGGGAVDLDELLKAIETQTQSEERTVTSGARKPSKEKASSGWDTKNFGFGNWGVGEDEKESEELGGIGKPPY